MLICFSWKRGTDVATCILRSSERNDVRGTHVVRWLSVSPPMFLVGPSAPGVERISTLQNFHGPMLNSRRFVLISKTQEKAIHRCQNTTPTRHSAQSLPILAPAFTFCNITSFFSKYIVNIYFKSLPSVTSSLFDPLSLCFQNQCCVHRPNEINMIKHKKTYIKSYGISANKLHNNENMAIIIPSNGVYTTSRGGGRGGMRRMSYTK